MSVNESTPRPGGRAARVRSAVHEAVIELLSEPGGKDVTVPAIAQRAGVNPTSIYRRWGTREALLADVAVTRLAEDSPLPDTGTLCGDLTQWATAAASSLMRPEGQLILRALVMSLPGTPEAQEERSRHFARRADDIGRILDRAAARGEDPPDIDQVLDHVLGPLYLRALFGAMPATPAYPQALVEQLLHGGSAPARPGNLRTLRP
ncbi:TetR/AcrR family transcriptional regulator [Streptomyces sp. GS7]|uniref:TetR/AcrR family transcriptional regulator n=1 Tax=Streptomyces sp. GS7 TaxID=2692234 RepID=UPI0013189957|nr:TetR/AcrR family transcriptional regulator [Streptomyces sp. GS7]QHC22603.1 TetR family transcriptional regulator [Streptomyces sp. GS7]